MYAWQQEILDKMTKYKGRGLVQITGRQSGKSQLSAQAFQRMVDDLARRPVQELVISEGKVYGARYYCVEPIGGSWLEMESWCIDTYGSSGSMWDITQTPLINHRWYMNDRKFWFRNETDRTLFVIKWS